MRLRKSDSGSLTLERRKLGGLAWRATAASSASECFLLRSSASRPGEALRSPRRRACLDDGPIMAVTAPPSGGPVDFPRTVPRTAEEEEPGRDSPPPQEVGRVIAFCMELPGREPACFFALAGGERCWPAWVLGGCRCALPGWTWLPPPRLCRLSSEAGRCDHFAFSFSLARACRDFFLRPASNAAKSSSTASSKNLFHAFLEILPLMPLSMYEKNLGALSPVIFLMSTCMTAIAVSHCTRAKLPLLL